MAEIKGGKALEQKLAAIAKALGTATRTLRVGFLANATYPDGTPVAMIAAIQNFGAPRAGIPPRPFFSNMVKDNKAAWPKEIAASLRATNFDADAALRMQGDVIAGQLRESIQQTNSPPLKPATVRRKARGGAKRVGGVYGPEKPLIDSGFMFQSVDFEIKS